MLSKPSSPPKFIDSDSMIQKPKTLAFDRHMTADKHKEPPDPVTEMLAANHVWKPPPSRTITPATTTPRSIPRIRMEPPRFTGDDASNWIIEIQRYFNHSYTPESDRLYLVTLLFDPPAYDWATYWKETNTGKSWDDFLIAVKHRFEPDFYEDYMSNNTTIKLPGPFAFPSVTRKWGLPPSLTQPPTGMVPVVLPRPRFDAPRFDGENVVEWIQDIQTYYNCSYTPLSDRLYLTKYLFDQPASDWMTSWKYNHAGESWDDFLLAVKQRFDPDPCEGPVATVRHTSPVDVVSDDGVELSITLDQQAATCGMGEARDETALTANWSGIFEKSTTPALKSQTSTSDRLPWPETPSAAVPSAATVARASQPMDGVGMVLFDGQIIDENSVNLNEGKPCFGYTLKEANDSTIVTGDSGHPRLPGRQKFVGFNATSDEPDTVLGVVNRDVFIHRHALASDARSIPPRNDVTHSGGSLSSGGSIPGSRTADSVSSSPSILASGNMLEVDKDILNIVELSGQIDTLLIPPSFPLSLEVENSLLHLMDSKKMDVTYWADFVWRYVTRRAGYAHLQHVNLHKLVGDEQQDRNFNLEGSFAVKFTDAEFSCDSIRKDGEPLSLASTPPRKFPVAMGSFPGLSFITMNGEECGVDDGAKMDYSVKHGLELPHGEKQNEDSVTADLKRGMRSQHEDESFPTCLQTGSIKSQVPSPCPLNLQMEILLDQFTAWMIKHQGENMKQPYHKISVSCPLSAKLSRRFYGPFSVLGWHSNSELYAAVSDEVFAQMAYILLYAPHSTLWFTDCILALQSSNGFASLVASQLLTTFELEQGDATVLPHGKEGNGSETNGDYKHLQTTISFVPDFAERCQDVILGGENGAGAADKGPSLSSENNLVADGDDSLIAEKQEAEGCLDGGSGFLPRGCFHECFNTANMVFVEAGNGMACVVLVAYIYESGGEDCDHSGVTDCEEFDGFLSRGCKSGGVDAKFVAVASTLLFLSKSETSQPLGDIPIIATKPQTVLVDGVPQCQWLIQWSDAPATPSWKSGSGMMRPLPSLSLEDKAIVMEEGVDRDLNRETHLKNAMADGEAASAPSSFDNPNEELKTHAWSSSQPSIRIIP